MPFFETFSVRVCVCARARACMLARMHTCTHALDGNIKCITVVVQKIESLGKLISKILPTLQLCGAMCLEFIYKTMRLGF